MVSSASRTALLLSGFLLGLGGCAGGPLGTSMTSESPRPAPDVYSCIREQLKAVGYSQTSYDEGDQRVTARKFDYITRPDVSFRRLVHRLDIDIEPSSGSGKGLTTITVQANTFAERETHRGPTEEQEKTAQSAKDAAQRLVTRCGQSQG